MEEALVLGLERRMSRVSPWSSFGDFLPAIVWTEVTRQKEFMLAQSSLDLIFVLSSAIPVLELGMSGLKGKS